MLLETSSVHESGPLELARGGRIERLTLAYESWGRLAPDGENAILVSHGYTSNPHAAGPGGWWEPLIGPGRAIDTDRWFVLCINMIGSAYGSSGPEPGRPFPDIEVSDMVAAQQRLLDHLGVGRLAAKVGFSFGGFLTFEWAASHPDRMRALVPVATGMAGPPGGDAAAAALRARFAGSGDPRPELRRQRIETLRNYGARTWFAARLGSEEAADAEIARQAAAWAGQFTPESLIVLRETANRFDARPKAGRIRAPLLYVLSRSDAIFGPELAEPTLAMLSGPAEYFELDSGYGHLAPSYEWAKWREPLGAFLRRHAA